MEGLQLRPFVHIILLQFFLSCKQTFVRLKVAYKIFPQKIVKIVAARILLFNGKKLPSYSPPAVIAIIFLWKIIKKKNENNTVQ